MHVNILWAGTNQTSLENCELIRTGRETTVHSGITGVEEEKLYTINYRLQINSDWHVTAYICDGYIIYQSTKQAVSLRLEVNNQKEWMINGAPAPELKGCIDIDLPLTPFTNTLPICRLQLGIGQSQTIAVVYVDLLAGEIKPVQQCYTRLGERRYNYQNIPNDFEAVITVDEAGLVEQYPGLFERRALVHHQ